MQIAYYSVQKNILERTSYSEKAKRETIQQWGDDLQETQSEIEKILQRKSKQTKRKVKDKRRGGE